jgi:hypothetical protein
MGHDPVLRVFGRSMRLGRRARVVIAGMAIGALLTAGTSTRGLNLPLRICVGSSLIDLRLCFPQALLVTYTADHGVDGGPQRHTEQISTIGVPTPLNVDGKPGVDVIARLSVQSLGTYSLEFNKAPTAAFGMPLRIAAVLKDPGGSVNRYAFGYDARMSTAPATFSTVVTPTLSDAGSRVNATIAQTGAGETMALIGQIHRAGANETVVDPTSASVRFTPVPPTVTTELSFPSAQAASRQTRAALTTDRTTRIDILGRSVQGDRIVDFAGTVDSLLGTASVTMEETIGGPTTYRYSGPDGLGRVHANLKDSFGLATGERGGQKANELDVVLRELPANVTATLAASDGVSSVVATDVAGVPDDIGSVEARLSNGPLFPGEQATVDKWGDADGALIRDVSSRFAVFVRISKLQSVALGMQQDKADVTLRTTERRDMFINVSTLSASGISEQIDAEIHERPLCLRIAAAKQRTTPDATCSGNGTIPLASVDSAKSPQTILFEGSERTPFVRFAAVNGFEYSLVFELTDLPRRVEAFIQGTKDAEIALGTLDPATGSSSPIARLYARVGYAHMPPHRTAPDTHDFVTLTKLEPPDAESKPWDVTVVKLTDLRSAHVRTDPTLDINVDVVPSQRGFIFDSSIDQPTKLGRPGDPPFGRQRTEVVLGNLSSNTRIKVTPEGTDGFKLKYDADEDVPSMTFLQDGYVLDQDGFPKDRIFASASPLRRDVTVCLRPKGPACGLDAWTGNEVAKHPTRVTDGPHPEGLTLVVEASGPMTVNFDKCLAPDPTGSCVPPTKAGEADKRRFVKVTDAVAQTARIQLSGIIVNGAAGDLTEKRTLVYLDTNEQDFSGTVKVRLPAGGDFEDLNGFFPATSSPFQAGNRRVRVVKRIVPEYDDSFPFSPSRTGTMNCPSAMTLGIGGGFLGIGGADLKGVICP